MPFSTSSCSSSSSSSSLVPSSLAGSSHCHSSRICPWKSCSLLVSATMTPSRRLPAHVSRASAPNTKAVVLLVVTVVVAIHRQQRRRIRQLVSAVIWPTKSVIICRWTVVHILRCTTRGNHEHGDFESPIMIVISSIAFFLSLWRRGGTMPTSTFSLFEHLHPPTGAG